MPLYEFRCPACEKISEFQLKLADTYPELCPNCGQIGLIKMMSLPAFQLKGGGWYKDAYDGKSNKKPETAPAADAKASPSSEGSPAAAPASGGTPSPTPSAAPAPAASSAPSSTNTSGKGSSS